MVSCADETAWFRGLQVSACELLLENARDACFQGLHKTAENAHLLCEVSAEQ